MLSVTIEVPFCYAHCLVGHAGKCRHRHGHNGVARVTVTGPKNDMGMVVDFSDLKAAVKGWVDANWDHNTILAANDPIRSLDRTAFRLVFGDREPYILDCNPTAENMAEHLYGTLLVSSMFYGKPVKILRVEISETGTSCAAWEE